MDLDLISVVVGALVMGLVWSVMTGWAMLTDSRRRDEAAGRAIRQDQEPAPPIDLSGFKPSKDRRRVDPRNW